MNLNINEIKKIIPHRKPFLFLDSLDIIERGKSGIGHIFFKEDEFFFEGHFPNNPIVPGVIIVEALAQAAGVVSGYEFIKEDRKVLFMSISSVKFRKPVKPNQALSLHVSKLNQVKNVYKYSGIAKRGDESVTEAVYTAMII
ncbi:MAG: 3-hydroxyacyl-[acyl-carrier-protein] dehydratase FabZ [Pelagibacteraceae bacterium]|nr:3-hydroxyacyl-[acyl-carrier-protein] dehydratase FabZ [Pelagibacteraceae bacterium]|tara:strand:- start:203 stop:628 length:426 start_codon:yes stop_codon:yes gene_type:complete